MLFNVKKKFTSLALISSITLLSACGGGSSNDAPEISGNESINIVENTTFVEQFTVIDDSNEFFFTIEGSDARLFSISDDGELAFFTGPETDTGIIDEFSISVIVTDNGGLSDSIDLTINVFDENDIPVQAVVQTVSPEFTGSSEVAYADGFTQDIEEGFYVQSVTDYTISIFEENVYHIGRSGIDMITKYDTNSPVSEIYTYSTQEAGDSVSGNPQVLVSVSDTKAYLIRLGANNVLIVNPAATNVEEYIIGELDISSYVVEGNDSGFNVNSPDAVAGVISDGKLFIALERFGIDFGSISTAYVAVFDIETDTEIETNANADDDLMGIPLTGFNPLNESLRVFEDKIYVTTNNSFLSSDITLSKIEEIDVNDFSLRTLFNASDVPNNTTGTITSSEILSAEQGYFYITSDPFGTPVSELYQFNPTTGDISTEPVFDFGTASINFLDIDVNGFLWLALTDNANPGVDIIDTRTNTQFGNRLPTTLNATVVRFIEE